MSDNQRLDLESSIVPTIAGDLSPLSQDLTEVAIDSVMNEGLLCEMPIVGALVGLWKTQASVREALYLKKILKFLGPISKATNEQRRKFVEQTLSSSHEKKKFSEIVIQLVERADSSEKTELYGRFFLAHIQGEYTYEEVLKICTLIESAFLPELRNLPLFMNAEAEDVLLTSELYRCGFLSLSGLDGGSFTNPDDGGAIYGINWYGEQVVRMLHKIDEERIAETSDD